MTCKNCGAKTGEGMAFCTNCGMQIVPATVETQPTGEQTSYMYAPPAQETPPQPGVPPSPQTQYYQPNAPQYPQYPPPPGYPPPYPPLVGKQKKSKTGLIIGIVCGSVALIALIIFAVIFVSRLIIDDITDRAPVHITTPDADSGILATPIPLPPTPRPPSGIETLPESPPPPATPEPPPHTPPPALVSDNELVGVWEFYSGGPVYFFILSEHIMFIEYEDGTLGVFESDYEEWGIVFIEEDGFVIIEGERSGTYEFVFILDGDKLTIIDIDGDAIHYTRIG